MSAPADGTKRRTVTLNGAPRTVAAATVAALLAELEPAGAHAGIAVAVNGSVVPRGRWDAHELRDGDRVDLVGAVQGG